LGGGSYTEWARANGGKLPSRATTSDGIMSISEVSMRDSGVYWCYRMTATGEATAAAQLVVKRK